MWGVARRRPDAPRRHDGRLGVEEVEPPSARAVPHVANALARGRVQQISAAITDSAADWGIGGVHLLGAPAALPPRSRRAVKATPVVNSLPPCSPPRLLLYFCSSAAWASAAALPARPRTNRGARLGRQARLRRSTAKLSAGERKIG